MGLDSIDLVMHVEDEFQIALSDREAEAVQTVGQLVDLIFSRLRHDAQEPCPSQHGFYVVRRHMVTELGAQRRSIRPETQLEELIGGRDRRKVWPGLISAITQQQMPWLRLVRPWWLNVLVALVLPVSVFLICLIWAPLVPALIAGVLAGFVGDRLTVPFKTEFPRGFVQVKDMIKFVKALDSRTWTKEAVFEKVKAIVVEELGVKESEIRPDAHFLRDLGVS